MIKRTFGEVKEELRRVAGQTGLNVDDPRLKIAVNLAQERLCTLGEWPYQYARIRFCQRAGIVALPTQYEAIVHATVDRIPVEVQPPWFEFLEYGPGPYHKGSWAVHAADMGESATYVSPPATGVTVKVTSTESGDTGVIKIFGNDVNGLAKTESLTLPDATSTTKWSRITQVTKPVTLGDVVLTFVDTFGQETVAADYRARDRNPSFRMYRFNGIADDQSKVVDAIVRRRLFEITSDTDEMFISNLSALRLGVKAVALLDKGEIDLSERSFAVAAQILRDEGLLYKGRHQPAPVNVSRVGAMGERGDIY